MKKSTILSGQMMAAMVMACLIMGSSAFADNPPFESGDITHYILIEGTSSTSRGFGGGYLSSESGTLTFQFGVVDRVFSSGTTTIQFFEGWYGTPQISGSGTALGDAVTCGGYRICSNSIEVTPAQAELLATGQVYVAWENGGNTYYGQVVPKDYHIEEMTPTGTTDVAYLTTWKVDETTLGYYINTSYSGNIASVYLWDNNTSSKLSGVSDLCTNCTGPVTGTVEIGTAHMPTYDNFDMSMIVDIDGSNSFESRMDYIISNVGLDIQSSEFGMAAQAALDPDDNTMHVRMTYQGSIYGLGIYDINNNLISSVASFDDPIPLTDAEETQLLNDELVYVISVTPTNLEARLRTLQEAVYVTPGLWTGADPNDNNWNTPGNWDDGQVPGTGVDVTIPQTGKDPVIGAAARCKNITIQTNAKLTINSSQPLDVTGNFTLNDGGNFTNNGTLKFSGSACELSDNQGSQSSLGNVTVEN